MTDPAPQPEASTNTGHRSFSRGLGFLLQGYGAAILLIMTCTCAGIAFFEADAWQAGRLGSASEVSSIEDPQIEDPTTRTRRGNAVVLIGAALSAFCLIGFGVGMQADRGALPALGAGITNAVMILAYGYASFLHFSASATWWASLLPACLAGIALLLTIVSFAAFTEVRQDPPATSKAPTVPAEAFPDPWATTKSADSSYDQPLKQSISKQRERLRKQLEDLDELEERLDGAPTSSSDPDHQ